MDLQGVPYTRLVSPYLPTLTFTTMDSVKDDKPSLNPAFFDELPLVSEVSTRRLMLMS